MHYFDYAATSPLSAGAKTAMISQLEEDWFNPSGQYSPSVAVARQISNYRQTISTALGCGSDEFYFTSGGTESNNWAIFSAVQKNRHKGNHCITSTIEHASVLECFKTLEKQGYEVSYITPNKEGIITPDMVKEVLKKNTILLSLMMVNNEIGVINPVEEIAKEVKSLEPHVLIHCDGVQGFLKVPFALGGVMSNHFARIGGRHYDRKLNLDLFSVSAHKVQGPKGVGGLFIRSGLKLVPQLFGGGQEQGLRSGTEATHQMAAFAAAVGEGYAQLDETVVELSEIKHQIISRLFQIPKVKLLFLENSPTAPHILAFSMVGYPSQVVLRFLGERGVYLSAGSACHRGGVSHVFSQLSLSKEEKLGVLRISISRQTTEEDIEALCQGLTAVTTELFPSF